MNAFNRLLLVCVLASSAAAEPALPRLQSPVRIDGDVSDDAWRTALHVERFYEVLPGDNSEPTVSTEAWLALDERALYVAFRADDPDASAIRAPWPRTPAFTSGTATAGGSTPRAAS